MKRLLLLSLVLALNPFISAHAQINNEPDTISTDKGDLLIYPVLHGSIVFTWNGLNIFVDPYGGASRYEHRGNPDLILITHPHDDHMDIATLRELNTNESTFIVPKAVAVEMAGSIPGIIKVLDNNQSIDIMDISIRAVPMYNLPEEGARHQKGWGNGYVLTIGDKNIYVSGDTEDIPEMRGLTDIDVAFICMNLPYTMDIDQAASAVLDFRPVIVYPYHHRDQDIEDFKTLVNAGNHHIEVRLKDWYPDIRE